MVVAKLKIVDVGVHHILVRNSKPSITDITTNITITKPHQTTM